MLSARATLAGGATVVAAGLCSAALASAGGEEPAGPLAFDDQPTPMTAQVSEAHRAFPVLRRARTVEDTMPAAVAALIGNPDVGGKNVGLARAISTAAGTGWVVPGEGSICLAAPDPAAPGDAPSFGVTCNATAWARQHGLGILLLDRQTGSGQVTVVVPDESAVVLMTPDLGASPLTVDADGVASMQVVVGDAVRVETPTGSGAFEVSDDGG